ncbi:MAG: IS607 family transposase [Candidatus Thermoplasmatota archaeon]
MDYISIGEVSVILGVSISTLRRWDKSGCLESSYRTFGNHRRYNVNIVMKIINKKSSNIRKVIGYSRVSSHDQKKDLVTQSARIELYLSNKYDDYEIIEDLGSGLNYKKRGLKKLIKLICNREISALVLTHKDRLLRFGSEIIFELCKRFGTDVVILDDKKETFTESLCNDVITLMTVFSARLYGSRSHKNKRKLANCA